MVFVIENKNDVSILRHRRGETRYGRSKKKKNLLLFSKFFLVEVGVGVGLCVTLCENFLLWGGRLFNKTLYNNTTRKQENTRLEK
jgi:hypothetical protein